MFEIIFLRRASPVTLVVKNPPAMQEIQEMQIRSLGREDPLEEGRQPTPVFLPGKSHEQRSLAGSSLWVVKSQTQLKRVSTSF